MCRTKAMILHFLILHNILLVNDVQGFKSKLYCLVLGFIFFYVSELFVSLVYGFLCVRFLLCLPHAFVSCESLSCHKSVLFPCLFFPCPSVKPVFIRSSQCSYLILPVSHPVFGVFSFASPVLICLIIPAVFPMFFHFPCHPSGYILSFSLSQSLVGVSINAPSCLHVSTVFPSLFCSFPSLVFS